MVESRMAGSGCGATGKRHHTGQRIFYGASFFCGGAEETELLGGILLVPSLFSRLSSVFGTLQNPVLLVLSSKNGRFRRPSRPSAF